MRRRDFLKLSATATAGAIVFQACDFSKWGDGSPKHEFQVESPRDIPEDYLYGNYAWYATVFPETPEAAGVVVRVFEGRAKKIEGNPNHPVNHGKLTARGQTMVQDLYHPDRIRTPSQLSGMPGTGNYEPIRWDVGLNQLTDILSNTPSGEVLVITQPLSGALRQIVGTFTSAIGGERISYQTLEQSTLREATKRVFGSNQLPTFDFANASFVLSFGADFLQSWVSPVQFGQGFAQFRSQSEESPRGQLYHVESRLSGTANAADKWIPVHPGQEGYLAMAIAGVIIEEGLGSGADAFNAIMAGATLPAPEDAAARTGVDAAMIRDIAHKFAGEGPSFAFGGGSAVAHTNGVANLMAIYALNLLVGNVNAEGGIQINAGLSGDLEQWGLEPAATASAWQDIIGRMQNGEFSTVLIHQANPVYGLPDGFGFETALRNVENVVSFSRYVDETSVLADLVLPDNVALESWGTVVPEALPGYPTIGIQQPVVLRFYDTRPFGDVILSTAEELGMTDALPWATTEDLVREQAETLRSAGGGNIQATGDAEAFWAELIQTGVWMNEESTSAGQSTQGSGTLPDTLDPQFAGDPNEFPFALVPYESVSLGAGEFSHLPWMQSLPDPITTAAWASWVEINPDVAKDLDVGTGDYVRVTSPAGERDVRVYVNRTTPPGIVAIPMGQGHDFYGRYAEGRGINVLDLVQPLTDSETGSLAWGATRVQVHSVGTNEKLPVLEGTADPVTPDDYVIVRKTNTPE